MHNPARVQSDLQTAPPERWPTLEFGVLDEGRFPAYRIVRDAAEAGGNRGAVVNAADEAAVAAFLSGRIGFGEIAGVIDDAVARWGSDRSPSLPEVAAIDGEVRDALTAELGA